MQIICEQALCTGCGACAGICPKNCISFKTDDSNAGHLFPIIDQSLCINCGLCERTCPANNHIKLNCPTSTYASYAVDETVCNTSASGGIAYTVAQEIINNGGVVYGSIVDYGPDFRIVHERFDNIADLKKTQGSKYVHSTIERGIYTSVKKDLNEGRTVLFVGTGCQIAGIRNFLKKDYPDFYTLDIICHGVPSLKLLKDYLSTKYDLSQIKHLKFRSKTGPDLYGIFGVYGASEEQIALPLRRNLYMMGFMKGLYYRPACYQCFYAQPERGGDITLGDFWGLKAKFSGRPASSRGTSVILVNTVKGKQIIDKIRSQVVLLERPVEEAVSGNPQLTHPSSRHFAYSIFHKVYPVLGFRRSAALSLIREKIFYAYILPLIQRIHGK